MPVCPSCHEHNPEVGASCPRCNGYHYVPENAVKDAEHDPMIGRIAADKYVVLSLINEGGMGAVYRALQLPVEREIALKVLRTELKDSDQAGDRFIREARAVSRLNHPNIITLYDFGFDSNRHPYMVMEYAPGLSLAKWIKQQDVTIERIIHVTHQILSALTEAHNRGIVHRDLKPDNMIVTQTGSDPDYIKLLDFGIARLINEGSSRSLTREGEVFGTPHYMAPEQAQGSKQVGPPADVYAVGIMLYEMLTGMCPFDAPTPLAVLFMHINDPIPELKFRTGVQALDGMQELVNRATAKEPTERFVDANEMRQALSELVATHGSGLASLATMQDLTGEVLMPGRIPRMTPMPDPANAPTMRPDESLVDVRIEDPAASFSDVQFATEPPNGGSRTRLIVAAIALLLVLALVGGVVAMTGGGTEKEPEATPATDLVVEKTDPIENDPKPDETEIAIKENNEAVADPLIEEKVDPLLDETNDENVEEKIEEKIEEKVVEKKTTKKKTTKKRPIRKKVTKTKPTETKKPAETTTTTKKKTEPKKFSSPVKKFSPK